MPTASTTSSANGWPGCPDSADHGQLIKPGETLRPLLSVPPCKERDTAVLAGSK
jgi:hypothetical protein